MEIKLRCGCGQVLKVGSEAAGQTGTCPACKNPIRIPTLEEVEEAERQASMQTEEAEEFEEEEFEEEEPSRKPSTSSFKAPKRTKTRAKGMASAKPEKEDRKKKDTGSFKKSKKGRDKTKTRVGSKTRSKTRSKTSALDKYRRKDGDEDGEGGYGAKKKSPVKILIVIAIVVVGGLIGAYALKWGPEGKAKKRTREYVINMQQFVNTVRDTFVEKYEKMFPASTSDFDNRLRDLKDDAGRVQGSLSQKMKNAYTADDKMHQVIRILDGAQKLIKERVDAEREVTITDEKREELKQKFTDEIAKANALVADIEKLINSLRPQIGMKMPVE